MTRKDYELIAHEILDAKRSLAPWSKEAASVLDYLAETMAGKFAADNPRFDRDRFLKACGVAG